jgi:hypothetical protein
MVSEANHLDDVAANIIEILHFVQYDIAFVAQQRTTAILRQRRTSSHIIAEAFN